MRDSIIRLTNLTGSFIMFRTATLSVVAGALLSLACTAGTGEPPPAVKPPASEIVSARPVSNLEIRAGGAAEVSVTLDIAEGFHINANPPTHPYLIPTQLEIVPQDGLTADAPQYPAPLTRKFTFDPAPLAVYEKSATIKLPLRAAHDATKGVRTLRAKIKTQACSDKECYPPRTFETSIPVLVS